MIQQFPDNLPWSVNYPRRCCPQIKDSNKMLGSMLSDKDAEYIVQACNEYPLLLRKIKVLEQENKKLKEELESVTEGNR